MDENHDAIESCDCHKCAIAERNRLRNLLRSDPETLQIRMSFQNTHLGRNIGFLGLYSDNASILVQEIAAEMFLRLSEATRDET